MFRESSLLRGSFGRLQHMDHGVHVYAPRFVSARNERRVTKENITSRD